MASEKALLTSEEGRQSAQSTRKLSYPRKIHKKNNFFIICLTIAATSLMFVTLSTVIAFLSLKVNELCTDLTELKGRVNVLEATQQKPSSIGVEDENYPDLDIAIDGSGLSSFDEEEERDDIDYDFGTKGEGNDESGILLDEEPDNDSGSADDEDNESLEDSSSGQAYQYPVHHRIKRDNDNVRRHQRRDVGASGESPPKRKRGKKGKGKGKKTKKDKKCTFAVNQNDGQFIFKSKNGQVDVCKTGLENFVKDVIKKEAPLNAIHLPADVQINDHQRRTLANNTNGEPIAVRNGHMYSQGYMPQNDTLALWSMANWTKENEKTSAAYKFHEDQGSVEILQSGLFYIYAQVTFHETQAHVGYHVVTTKNGQRTMLFTCLTGVDILKDGEAPTPDVDLKDLARYRTCSTNGIVQLEEGERLRLITHDKISKVDSNEQSTFWGVIQLAVDPTP